MDSTDLHANVRSVTCFDHSFGGDGHSGKGWGLWDGNFILHRIHVWYIIPTFTISFQRHVQGGPTKNKQF